MLRVLEYFAALWLLCAVLVLGYFLCVVARWPKMKPPTLEEQRRTQEWQQRKLRASKRAV
jgi:hypothetical protein